MEHGFKWLEEGFPLCLRLHGILFSHGRGSCQTPDEFRKTQNWIGDMRPGNAVFIFPPPDRILATTPVLEKVALAHVQFETIHPPFLDSNGRLG
jgi:Fic family protein